MPNQDDEDSGLGSDSGAFDELLREAARADPVSIEPGLTGSTIGHYHVGKRLGRGGMGAVYRATDSKLRREVAIKVLLGSFAQDPQLRARLIREARAAAAVTHANIATIYDVGEEDGRVFLAMELVEGETLRARIERGVSIEESLRVAKEIARGLSRAHEKGIVHRDVKPENVMITRHDEVKILDFGLAKRWGAAAGEATEVETGHTVTLEGRVLGTPAYMSPEQVRGTAVDARTDVFAFGVVLFEMLTGTRPFGGETTQDVLASIVRDPPPRASERNPEVPGDLERVVDRCLEKDRERRFASGKELLEALEGVEAARPRPSLPTTSLVTPSGSTFAPRETQRRAAAVVVGVVLLAGAGAMSLRALSHRTVVSVPNGAALAPPSMTVAATADAGPSLEAAAEAPAVANESAWPPGAARRPPPPSPPRAGPRTQVAPGPAPRVPPSTSDPGSYL